MDATAENQRNRSGLCVFWFKRFVLFNDGSSPTQSGSRQKVDGRIAMSASLVIQSLGDPELELGALKSCETMSMMSALLMVRCAVASASVG